MRQTAILFIAFLLPFIAEAQTQIVAGKVYDEASKAPLAGAVVVVLNSTPQKGAVSDETGRFRIDSVGIGHHSFKITYLSFEEKVISDVEITAGKEVNLNVGMQEEVHTLKEINVVYNKSKDKNHTLRSCQ